MLTIRLAVADLASVRFAYSPMQEAAFSLSAWLPSHRNRIYRPWLTETAAGRDSVDWPLLLALRGARGWLPDFITPWPRTARPDITTELETIRQTPPDLVLHDLENSHGPDLPPPLAALAADPVHLANALADAFGVYWRAVMAPRWPRMSALLQADITYRSHRIATGGAAALFEDLDEHITWSDGIMRLDEPMLDADVDVSGRGLPLMPSIFPRGVTALIDADQSPILTYPARGRGTLLHLTEGPDRPLVALLGRTRALLLQQLAEPASTTRLAHATGLTPGAISPHLRILTENGLLTRSRAGHSVLYQQTPLGKRLSDPTGTD